MSDVAIRVENLSKQFVLGERIGVKTFRESLQDALTAPFRRWVKGDGQAVAEKVDTDREIWALKDVSFEVKHGEVLGIIGPNGAGKSTLLKILSRITEPTGGYAEIRGRVGSLLEVGTGFHPELTGRENVYLNGSILGMSKSEIRRKFDDIVSFAGVERFIDTPVKRYSSGMQVRLAFAVAAHLEPEILIIDEVLAVGDAEFQKRCLGKMDEVSRSGRTILFVSHNMAAVEGLCTRAILLTDGRLTIEGHPNEIVMRYLNGRTAGPRPDRSEGLSKIIRSLRVKDREGNLLRGIAVGMDTVFEVDIFPPHMLHNVELALRFYNVRGDRVQTLHTRFQYPFAISLCGPTRFRCVLRNCRLMPGTYPLHIILTSNREMVDCVDKDIHIEVFPCDVYKMGRILPPHTGIVVPDAEWALDKLTT